MATGTIGGNSGLNVTGGSKATVKSGSVAKREVSKFKQPNIVQRVLKNTCVWLGVGMADNYEEQARQLRECRIKIDTCATEIDPATENLRDDDHA